jgi:hypothetical protein
MTPARPQIAWTLATLTFLFAGRIVGQMIQRWAPQSFLPPFHSFQGSSLPYGVLLPIQILILSAMIRSTRNVGRGTSRPNARLGAFLALFGGLYLFIAVTRIGIGLLAPEAGPWFRAWIPAAFHVVLAAFVVSLARYHRMSHARTT